MSGDFEMTRLYLARLLNLRRDIFINEPASPLRAWKLALADELIRLERTKIFNCS